MTNVKTVTGRTEFNKVSIEEMFQVVKGLADQVVDIADVKTFVFPFGSAFIISQRDGDSELVFEIDENSKTGCILNMEAESSNPDVLYFVLTQIWNRCFKDEETFIKVAKEEIAKLAV